MLVHLRRLTLVTALFGLFTSPTMAERLLDVWQLQSGTSMELIADPKFEAGFSVIPACNNPDGNKSCADSNRYTLKDPGRVDMADVTPVWEVAQWGSRSNLSGGARFEAGYGWATPDKRLVVFPDGRVELAVSGDSEQGGAYNQDRLAQPNMILQQTIAAPGKYGRSIPSIAEMSKLTFNLDFRKVYDDQNKKTGYNPVKHAIIFPVNFTIQNLNRRSPGYGQYVWLQISTYDDRYDVQPWKKDRTQIDLGTKSLIYFIPPQKLSTQTTHSGEWVAFHGDILLYARKAVEIAYEKGMVSSGWINDYTIGGMNIGYELTGLNISTFQFRNLSLRASTHRGNHRLRRDGEQLIP